MSLQAAPARVPQGVRGPPRLDPRDPLRRVAGCGDAVERRDHGPGVPHDGAVDGEDLADLRGVDVDVDLDRARAEPGRVEGDPVVPPRPDGHDEVAVGHGLVGVGGAVHAQHAEAEGVRLGKSALAEQGVHHGDPHPLGERADLGPGSQMTTPWPTSSTGRRAAASSLAASATAAASTSSGTR